MLLVINGLIAAVSLVFILYIFRELRGIGRRHQGAFASAAKLRDVAHLFGLLMMVLAVVLLGVGANSLRVSLKPAIPKVVAGPVSAGEPLALPRTQQFKRLIWATPADLDAEAVSCRQVTANDAFNNQPVAITRPGGWPADSAVTVDGKAYTLLTSTDVFDGREIVCSGGGLAAYAATADTRPLLSRNIGIGMMVASPFVLIAGFALRRGTRPTGERR